jgi:ABC-type antimicrobial peptide transport system permease subunit
MAGVLEVNGDGSPNFAVKLRTSATETITKPTLREAIVALFEGDCDIVLFYFSGHGFIDKSDGYLVTTDAATLVPEASRVIRELDPEQPLANVQTLAQIRDESVAPARLNVFLLGSVGALALLIAVVGIAGVLAFSVSQRTGEIGIRMSLGADAGRVRRMVIAEGGWLLLLGLVLGVAASLLGARVVAGLLYGVSPYDPVTLAAVALLMGTVGLVAAWLPAERAARVQPGEAMRTE